MENAAQMVRSKAGDVGLRSVVAYKRGMPTFFIFSRENKADDIEMIS